MGVEGSFRDSRASDDLVYSRCPISVAIEKLFGCFQNTLSCFAIDLLSVHAETLLWVDKSVYCLCEASLNLISIRCLATTVIESGTKLNMRQEITIVDAFTKIPFKGNPAGVCVMKAPMSEDLMRKIAAEVNLSETAFLYSENNGFRLRWFTPVAEVDLCGHATLASAHSLWESGITAAPTIQFYTLSGTLTATKTDDGIELDFPVEQLMSAEVPKGLLDAVGGTAIFTGKSAVRYFIELASAEEVRTLKPNFAKIVEYPPARVVVTAQSDDARYDFISRYFAPGIGIPEDPVTGSAHCALASYWAVKFGKTKFSAYQASPRGGELKVELDGSRVRLTGFAKTVLRGTLDFP